MKTFYLAIGPDYCFHPGNRVAINERTEDSGETLDSTVAEVWPVEAGSDLDVQQGRAMLLGLRAGSAMLEALQECLSLISLEADTLQNAGVHPDRINNAIDSVREAIALAELSAASTETEITGMQEG